MRSKYSIENSTNLSPELIRLIEFIWNESIGELNELFECDFARDNQSFASKFNLDQVKFRKKISI